MSQLEVFGDLKVQDEINLSDSAYLSASLGGTGDLALSLSSSPSLARFYQKLRSDVGFNVNGTDGITVTDTVITALQDNAVQLQYKSKTITFTGGIRTATGAESDWTDVPSA